jgi:hypothetical protein
MQDTKIHNLNTHTILWIPMFDFVEAMLFEKSVVNTAIKLYSKLLNQIGRLKKVQST